VLSSRQRAGTTAKTIAAIGADADSRTMDRAVNNYRVVCNFTHSPNGQEETRQYIWRENLTEEQAIQIAAYQNAMGNKRVRHPELAAADGKIFHDPDQFEVEEMAEVKPAPVYHEPVVVENPHPAKEWAASK
jgi:hypothetical protein